MKQPFPSIRAFISVTASAAILATSVLVNPAFADPFRSSNPRAFNPQTEKAFNAIFSDGNYTEAQQILQQADGDPMAYGMQAALAYLEGDSGKFKTFANKTYSAAQALVKRDPLRGNIYLAAGEFLQGGAIVLEKGTIKGGAEALGKLQRFYDYLDEAEKIAPNDPELLLLRGYMDLLIGVTLPLATPNDAIKRLNQLKGQSNRTVRALVDRGLAIAYRDLKNYSNAKASVDAALRVMPDNPDLYYLQAQILSDWGQRSDAVQAYEKALSKQNQLPYRLTAQIAYEHCKTKEKAENKDLPCQSTRKAIRRGDLSSIANLAK